jgi:undecaprenyl diphosphate synthase
MDGNKRWSKLNKLDLKDGYNAGFNKIKEIIKISINNNIKYLTVFALSYENTKRPSVSIIYKLLSDEYKAILKKFNNDKDVKINIIGERESLPNDLKNIFNELEIKTKNNSKLILNIAFNYGSNQEIISVIKKIIRLDRQEKIEINEKLINREMYLSNIPDPEILIRTGGFKRLSNFLLFKLSYTELFFTETLWPDLGEEEILKIFSKFKTIKRNYGL